MSECVQPKDLELVQEFEILTIHSDAHRLGHNAAQTSCWNRRSLSRSHPKALVQRAAVVERAVLHHLAAAPDVADIFYRVSFD